jgi:hypothetical protein
MLAAVPAVGQVETSRFQGRDAWALEGPEARVTILQSGGHVGEIVLKGADAVNPLWIPPRATMDPDRYDPEKHGQLYGRGPSARLMSGLLGHNLCFPFWGDPSPPEAAAGMGLHGEAGVLRWRMVSSGRDWLAVSVDLPDSMTRFVRRVSLSGRIVAFEETAANLSGWDRPVGWCEHVTLGPPFLDRGVTLFDASLTRGYSDDSPIEFVWPEGLAGGSKVDLRRMRDVERGPGLVNHYLVDPQREYGFFTALNPKLGLLFGYVFRRTDFCWLNAWESIGPREITRGMEFSDTPVHATMRGLFSRPEVFSTPAFEWLDGKSKLVKKFWAFITRVPAGFRGAAGARWSGDQLEIVERETGRPIALGPAPGFRERIKRK